jgi:hypothetical protein
MKLLASTNTFAWNVSKTLHYSNLDCSCYAGGTISILCNSKYKICSFYCYIKCRAHQTRRSGQNNSQPISAEEVTLPRFQSEINVDLLLFVSHSFLANNFRLMVKLIDKAIVINVKIY